MASMSTSDRATVGRKGRALVTRRYTWESIAREMISVYHWMIAAGPRPDSVVDA
jgi:hypothetical protein